MARPAVGGTLSSLRRAGPGAGRLSALVATGIGLATLAGTTANASASPFLREIPGWQVALGVAAGLLLVAASWVVGAERPRVAESLALAALGLLVPTWAAWSGMPESAQAAVLAAAPLAVAGAAGIGLAWRRGVAETRTCAVVLALALVAAALLLLAYDPLADPGCTRTCAHVSPPLAVLVTTRAAVAVSAVLVAVAGLLTARVLLGGSGQPWTVTGSSLVALVLLAAPPLVHAVTWDAPPGGAADVAAAAVAGLLLGAGPLLATAAARRVRHEVRDLADALSRGGLARLGHGTVRAVEFALASDPRWVDPAGVEVAAVRPGRSYAVLSDASGPVLRLEVARAADAEAVLATISPAVLLALRDARLAALRAVRLSDVRRSQRRIVSASDEARQRIERDLHDGAQQRLVSVALQLSLAGARLDAGDRAGGHVARARERVGEALAQLRALGHGIFPAALATEGLHAALEDLSRASDVDVALDVPPLALERDVALAAYAVVDAALAEARAAGPRAAVRVAASAADGAAWLRVELDGVPVPSSGTFALAGDRVGAVGGRLAIETAEGGAAIEAVLPCA
jgi:signal transduction histidine kinase